MKLLSIVFALCIVLATSSLEEGDEAKVKDEHTLIHPLPRHLLGPSNTKKAFKDAADPLDDLKTGNVTIVVVIGGGGAGGGGGGGGSGGGRGDVDGAPH
ncbi:unnamed protein product [Sphenostylis stenocarpa]|uniref:Secreted protein n=1 Tax=Sphenostylis stenocarpa TaxID=92480 RepID=A0AA86TGW7_9FABA|nr:unnamed protein product [Sphenostylis stenocarpa]